MSLRYLRRGWERTVTSGLSVGDAVFYSASDLRVLGTRKQLEEVVEKMRVKGKKGSINEGVVGDVTDAFDAHEHGDDEWAGLADEPSHVVEQLAEAVVRGDLSAGNQSNPIDVEYVRANDIEARAHDILLTGDAKAKAGDHVGAAVDEPSVDPTVEEVAEEAPKAKAEKKA